jgi:hypothetical protein
MGWKSAVPAFALAVIVLPFAVSPAAAQTYGFLRVGNTASSDDPFCEDPASFFTSISAGITAPLAGFTVEYNNGDWPWPEEALANGTGPLFLTHGRSIQFMAELNPVQFVASGLSRYARPFVGLGLNISTDGEARPDTGDGPAYGVKGQTRPFIAYGVNGILPVGTKFGVTAGYRGTSVFYGDFEFVTPSGAVVKTDGSTLSSHTWTVGFTVGDGN